MRDALSSGALNSPTWTLQSENHVDPKKSNQIARIANERACSTKVGGLVSRRQDPAATARREWPIYLASAKIRHPFLAHAFTAFLTTELFL